MERLAWKPVEFAESIGVSRAKAYEILAENPQLTVRVGASLRVLPERAREWLSSQVGQRTEGASLR